MICISPIAPFGEIAWTSPKLSARITARIHAAGMPKRHEASATNVAREEAAGKRAKWCTDVDCASADAPGTAETTETHATINAPRKCRVSDRSGHEFAEKEEGRRPDGCLAEQARARCWRMSILLPRPEGIGAVDDRHAGKQAEVAAIEGILGLPVHEEDLTVSDALAALPDRKRPAARVTVKRISHCNAIDSDGPLVAADGLSGKCKHALQHRYALGKIAPISEELRQRVGRTDDDELGDVENAGRMDGVEPDRDAIAGVPNKLG